MWDLGILGVEAEHGRKPARAILYRPYIHSFAGRREGQLLVCVSCRQTYGIKPEALDPKPQDLISWLIISQDDWQ